MGDVLPRERTRQVDVGGVKIGGGAPVVVQSMTCTNTADAESTLAQVRALANAGCDIVRVTRPIMTPSTRSVPYARHLPFPSSQISTSIIGSPSQPLRRAPRRCASIRVTSALGRRSMR